MTTFDLYFDVELQGAVVLPIPGLAVVPGPARVVGPLDVDAAAGHLDSKVAGFVGIAAHEQVDRRSQPAAVDLVDLVDALPRRCALWPPGSRADD